MRFDLQALAFLGIGSARLDPAPAGPLRATGYRARIYTHSPTRRARCSSGGRPQYGVRPCPGSGLA
ncbi:hypothetical protein [Streptomyces carpinensis]|uniref:Uncharacterized protein n=1 Tax=Streptomyces carpinensis TaxID=66369 RepID=A0ABV1W0D5_9ACTN|nr:hypothetical protein [Streptomyces carpinensis]